MTVFNRSHVTLFVHIFCWLIFGFGALYYHPSTWDTPVPTSFWIKQTLVLAILISVFYLNSAILIPRLLIRKKVSFYIAFVLVLLVLVYFLNTVINTSLNLDHLISTHKEHHPIRADGHRIWFNTYVPSMTLLMIGLGITVSFIQKWQHEVSLREQLEKEKVTTELTLLKAQINPHFFFNTLNTIYSYTLSDGDVARTAITNLSKMMRYVLYDASGKQTPLNKEIDFIKEYVELMKLRISNKTTVLLQIEERTGNAMIAPMIFLPFIENAFKHGVSGLEEGHITIWIMQNEDSVELRVKNTVYKNRRASEEESNGIGIANTTRRLELLYAGNYTLSTGLVGYNEYEAKLKLIL